MPLALTFPSSRLFFHHQPGVTLGRAPNAEMLLLILKHLLLTKKITNAFLFQEESSSIISKVGVTTLLRTRWRCEDEAWAHPLPIFLGLPICFPRHTKNSIDNPFIFHLILEKVFKRVGHTLFIVPDAPLPSWHEFNLVYNSLIWLPHLTKWRKLSHWYSQLTRSIPIAHCGEKL